MKASTLKRLEDLEVEALTRKIRAMSDEELIAEFTRLDKERRRALGLPMEVTFEERVRDACEAEGIRP